ncbi:hypothetical protein A4U49_15370 [Acidithiobacillus ferrivorans]|uniref:DedA family protein n=1 Tax=Acidithiobacillus ferrivorans TaxID=160808 RepID=UPI000893C635|nr:DedA family protein [Acidithiobacillus ferrivorans]OFA14958.1 hypothetical protein A4U49_15370 [Acidithiobacillus ferrivorans]
MHWFLHTIASLIVAATPILREYGIWAVVFGLFFEGAGVLFIPGESIIVAAGFLAAKGVFPILEVFPVAILSAPLGGYLAYGLGAKYGHAGLLRYGRYVWIKPEMVDKVHRFFHRFGVPVVAIGRFIVPLRQLQGYLAGSAEMGFVAFSIWSAVGAVAWVGVWGLGAYWLADSIPA